MIEIKNLSYHTGNKIILNNITTTFEAGKFTALIGMNGSGKSTLTKLLNALYLPTLGNVTVDGIDTSDYKALKTIRSSVGMVFQDPSLQAVASVVEDDIAFAPEHLGLSSRETNRRVADALSAAGITHLKDRVIATLSGGEKQLTAIAAVLAMNPKYIVFDEATSMLDPTARKNVFNLATELAKKGTGIIWITQNMEEAEKADTVTVIHNGKIALSDTPYNVFYKNDITQFGLDEPESIRLKKAILKSGINPDELVGRVNND